MTCVLAYLQTRVSVWGEGGGGKRTVHDISRLVRSPVCIVGRPAMAFVAIALIVTPSILCLVDILVARSVVCRGDYSDGNQVARFDCKRPALLNTRPTL